MLFLAFSVVVDDAHLLWLPLWLLPLTARLILPYLQCCQGITKSVVDLCTVRLLCVSWFLLFIESPYSPPSSFHPPRMDLIVGLSTPRTCCFCRSSWPCPRRHSWPNFYSITVFVVLQPLFLLVFGAAADGDDGTSWVIERNVILTMLLFPLKHDRYIWLIDGYSLLIKFYEWMRRLHFPHLWRLSLSPAEYLVKWLYTPPIEELCSLCGL